MGSPVLGETLQLHVTLASLTVPQVNVKIIKISLRYLAGAIFFFILLFLSNYLQPWGKKEPHRAIIHNTMDYRTM